MYCVRKVTDDLTWIGANDRRLALFEGVYKIPMGVSYNSYVLLDEKTVVFDTVDASASKQYLENLDHVLGGRKLDYVIVQHMEMDHAATLGELVVHHPEVTIVCNELVAQMMEQFFDFSVRSRLHLVAEGDTFCTGKHTFTFVAAPWCTGPKSWSLTISARRSSSLPTLSARSAPSTARCLPTKWTSSTTILMRPAVITPTSWVNTALRYRRC